MTDVLARLQGALTGKYVLERELGAGGMATVYLAEDPKHHRKVAIKVLRPDLAAVLGGARFLREIEIAAQLSHPHILPLYDSGDADGLLYYVMPYVEGESLRDRIATGGAMPIGDAVRLLRDVADALAAAHARGVVHRDIKPDNVMVSGRHALVTDFGVAKALSEAGAGGMITTIGISLGTPAYMAPEQAVADPHVDHRADLYAFGVLAYEMLTGRLPFAATTAQQVMAAHVTSTPKPLLEVRPEVPPALAALVMHCLEKQPNDRFQSADAILAELDAMVTPGAGVTPVGSTPVSRMLPRSRGGRMAAFAAAIVVLGGGALLLSRHNARVHWARETAIPLIRQYADSADYEAAFALATQAAEAIPRDTTLAKLWPRFSRLRRLRTVPAGATVWRRPYLGPDSTWHRVGVTPLDSVRIPSGTLELRFDLEGSPRLRVAVSSWTDEDSAYVLSDVPAGMVHVPGGVIDELNLSGLEHLGGVSVGSYAIDEREVTNRQFKVFVDSGGYRRHDLWEEPFVLDGRPVPWQAAMARFTDRTGRPGPATWEAGDFPAGQGDFPVAGVSWYEAMAYAKFVGKRLPTIYHWGLAAGTPLSSWIIPRSNFGGRGATAVGASGGVGPYGTLDMAGNVREWTVNSDGADRYILGGGYNDPTYSFNDSYAQRVFDRSVSNGFRLMQALPGDTTLARAGAPAVRAHRDFAKERPVGDAIFAVYRRLYDYDRTALGERVEETDSSADDWVRQRISFDAAYGRERVTAYLFLPRTGRPPYQSIVYFPGSNAIHDRSFRTANQSRVFDFILKSGRAVMYPIYKGTYERGDSLHSDYPDVSNFYRDHVVMWAKDMRRSLDYLATRRDMDTTKFAYYGVSWGGYLGGLMPAVEPRIRTVLLLVAGLENQRGQPEVEPINFLPRIRVPVLMLNGRYDHYFPVESAQKPFFRFLGTPASQKRQIISEGGHYVPRTQLITEVLAWLDRYLGPVR